MHARPDDARPDDARPDDARPVGLPPPPGRRGGRFVAVAASLALLLALHLAALLAGGGAVAAEYRLGSQDKVRLRVYEWRAAQDQLFEWEALNDEFTVAAGGTLPLPVVGDVPAAGRTPAEVARAVGERLQARLGLHERPDTSLDVVTYRPFYIVGHVDKPGEYPYRPGLTVLQALSIGGGLTRLADMGLMRLERDVIVSRGDLALLDLERDALIVRGARLETERNGLDVLEVPPPLRRRAGNPTVALILTQERMIMQARWQAFRTQNEALEQLKAFLEKEITSLEAQIVTQDTQMRLVNRELQSVTTLVEKGLTAAPRQLGLERTVAQVQGDRLRLESSLLKAHQEISRANISILELRNGRSNEIALEARQTAAKLEEAERRADTAGRLLREAEVTAPQFILERGRATRAQPVFTITRGSGSDRTVVEASETTLVEPGDAIKVELPRLFDDPPEVRSSALAPAPSSQGAARGGAQGAVQGTAGSGRPANDRDAPATETSAGQDPTKSIRARLTNY